MNRIVRPPLQTRKLNAPLPSGGGRADGYPQLMREFAIGAEQAGLSNNIFIEDLQQQRLYPCDRTVSKWRSLQAQFVHVMACRRTGNIRATVLQDHNIVLLALYRLAFPKATCAEINAFLYRAN